MEILDAAAFDQRLALELARTRRLGGYVSLGMLGPATTEAESPSATALHDAAQRLAECVRSYETVGWVGPARLAILLPGADPGAAMGAGSRLLAVAAEAHADSLTLGFGVATAYGEIEGGGDALRDAVETAFEQAMPGQVKQSATSSDRPRILVVDDDAPFAHALVADLVERGWLSHPCVDAREALERVRDPCYHALFVDLVLGSTSGVAVLRESHKYLPQRPAILMSGFDSRHEEVLDALSLGPVMFIGKPISKPDLDAALRMFKVLLPGLVEQTEGPAATRLTPPP